MLHYDTLPSQDKTEFPWGTLNILSMESESLQTYLENNSQPSLKKKKSTCFVVCNSFRMQNFEVSNPTPTATSKEPKNLKDFS